MSEGPTRNPVSVNLLSGKITQFSMSTQSSAIQNLEIQDADGTSLVEQSGQGTSHFFAAGGRFTAGRNPHTVTITANNRNSSVRYSSAMISDTSGNIFEVTHVLASEDGGDGDYNDCFVTLTSFARSG
ncbi:MAG: hypothetical protein ETSY1_06835 [Candidatus Entotheonella factor]|uniref:Calcium-mediated lectin domain-containing protein n=1 Tax=Entotheonella factor TaxID=1429438 RepID=W4LW21_ENTF1|nr:MAG: hypothetical protein ETSY1_06835 [Candidatus Entotheonella factor]